MSLTFDQVEELTLKAQLRAKDTMESDKNKIKKGFTEVVSYISYQGQSAGSDYTIMFLFLIQEGHKLDLVSTTNWWELKGSV